MSKYIGEDMVYGDPVTGQSICLENGTDYNVQFHYEGPQVVINNQVVQHPDATIWAVIDDGRVNIPFAPNLIHDFWEE